MFSVIQKIINLLLNDDIQAIEMKKGILISIFTNIISRLRIYGKFVSAKIHAIRMICKNI